MRCYLIRDAQITVLSQVPTSPKKDTHLIQSVRDFNQARFPLPRLISIWNTLPDAEPVKRFRNRAAAVKRVWAALEALPVSSAKSTSKQTQMIALLQRPGGASMDDLIAATGWQRHSVRGVLSGVLRKKRGLTLSTSREDGRRVYRAAP